MDSACIKRLQDSICLYELLECLETKCSGMRQLTNCSSTMKWPRRGVYFFFEPGELRTTSGEGLRVVRVGTHALKRGGKATLWDRLRQHCGSLKAGGGNHRGSVFRKHVGSAIIIRDQLNTPGARSWGVGSTASKSVRLLEHPIEQTVSAHIRPMPFLWLAINDPPGRNSRRAYIECNAIALLSNYRYRDNPIDPASPNWLGQYARNEKVRRSGLWNDRCVDQDYDPKFLDVLKCLIDDDP